MPLLRALLKMVPASTALLMILFAAPTVRALEVNTVQDENGDNPFGCSFREAVRTINDQSSFGGCVFIPGDDLVELGPGTLRLSLDVGPNDRIEISQPMTVLGLGPGFTTIERRGAFDGDLLRIDLDTSGMVTLEGFAITGAAGQFRSAIRYASRSGSELVMRDLVIRDNSSRGVSAFEMALGEGTARLERVLIADNTSSLIPVGGARGGGMHCDGDGVSSPPSVSLEDVVFRNNTVAGNTTASGGGLLSSDCDLSLTNVTFDHNSASSVSGDALGGGLALVDGGAAAEVVLTNVTFVGNSAAHGGGLSLFSPGVGGAASEVTLTNVTFAHNTASAAGAHLFQDDSLARLRNVLFGPSTGADCDGDPAPALALLGGNMDSDGSCGVERTEPDPGLAAELAAHGAFAPTLALEAGAAAIDAGTNDGCPAADQRGATRPGDGDGDGEAVCDIGAFEVSNEIFADGFESGDTSAWSATVASCTTCR
jgi:CSLREA domain-containing protein